MARSWVVGGCRWPAERTDGTRLWFRRIVLLRRWRDLPSQRRRSVRQRFPLMHATLGGSGPVDVYRVVRPDTSRRSEVPRPPPADTCSGRSVAVDAASAPLNAAARWRSPLLCAGHQALPTTSELAEAARPARCRSGDPVHRTPVVPPTSSSNTSRHWPQVQGDA